MSTAKKTTKKSKLTKKPAAKPVKRDSSKQKLISHDEPALKNYIEILEKVNRGLRAYISEMTIVFQFIERVSTIHSVDKIVELLLEVLRELCHFEAAAVYLHESSQDKIMNNKIIAEDKQTIIKKLSQTMEIDDRIYQWVFQQGHAVVIPESFRKKNSNSFQNWSFMIAPLATNSERIGHIELAFDRPQGSFTQQMFSILNVLLKHVAVIMVNERVYDKERQTAQKYIELDMLKKDVVNTTTHEIKTPLTIIQAASILLEGDEKMEEDERQELLKKIIQQCKRIDLIVSELFETAQVDEQQPIIKPTRINLKKITEETIKDVMYNPKKISFEVTIAKSLNIEIDKSSFYKVIRNLIENAVKYSPAGGTITIEAKPDKSKVKWQIKDQGIGISSKEQQQIFDKFFRGGEGSTRRVGGIGLGLYIVKKNIELNRGTIQVESQPNQGSQFTLTFPKSLLDAN